MTTNILCELVSHYSDSIPPNSPRYLPSGGTGPDSITGPVSITGLLSLTGGLTSAGLTGELTTSCLALDRDLLAYGVGLARVDFRETLTIVCDKACEHNMEQ